MERVLNQEEIDALIRRARGQQTEDPAKTIPDRAVKPYTFRQTGQLGRDQLRPITSVHEGLARSLAQSLGAFLGVPFDMKLVSVEQLSYAELLERMSQVTYFASLRVSPMNASAAIQIDHSLISPIIDILLGGAGCCEVLTREVTEIEEQILETVTRLICREINVAWAAMSATAELVGRENCGRLQKFLPMSEKILCISFEVVLENSRGSMNLICSAGLSNLLLRRLGLQNVPTASVRHISSKLRKRMLDCPFPVALRLTSPQNPIEDLLSLVRGSVLKLTLPIAQPASLVVGDKQICDAQPVQHGSRRAAQIAGPVLKSKELPRQ